MSMTTERLGVVAILLVVVALAVACSDAAEPLPTAVPTLAVPTAEAPTAQRTAPMDPTPTVLMPAPTLRPTDPPATQTPSPTDPPPLAQEPTPSP